MPAIAGADDENLAPAIKPRKGSAFRNGRWIELRRTRCFRQDNWRCSWFDIGRKDQDSQKTGAHGGQNDGQVHRIPPVLSSTRDSQFNSYPILKVF
jgi:hypothetical protein